MVQNQTTQNNPQQAIILDLSLFIIDLIDKTKIQQNVTSRGDILEVPSALVEMLRDSRVGSPVLFLFVHSLLAKTIKKYKARQINDPRIINLFNSTDQVVRGEAWKITRRLYDEFSSLIDIVPKAPISENLDKAEDVYPGEGVNYPIRRYDLIGSFSHEDQKSLQEVYTRELGIPEHPLYDQYFSQIYHAQTVGGIEGINILRKAVSLDEETFNIVSEWKGGSKPLEEKSQVVEESRNFLKWFIFTYIKDERQALVFDTAYDISRNLLELSVAGALAGATIGPMAGISLVTLAGGTLLKSIADAPHEVISKEHKPIIFIIASFLVLICVVAFSLILSRITISAKNKSPVNSNSSLYTQTPIIFLPSATLTPTYISIATETLQITETPLTATASTPDAINIINSPNYCNYVVQPGDTVQSVASWFNLSENDLRDSDNLVNQGSFGFHQLIKVNAPCCTHFGLNNGYSYSIQLKDNVFRLAINNRTSVEKIVEANNLDDSRYIQFGQMLCMPYP